ncbi:valine--tRNA ligase [Persicobacter psychrovividus]|uniref:Valine--tRNA ligase n=1 Tax=Persicobacter psychrovividus TaxID=387638 RepID=A0ABN6L8P1_9BACT|nr:valine--tRNA ligase [Persicobacter psychrovividus]
MTLSTKYNPSEVEDKWYQYWMENKFFASKPDPEKEPYSIVIPPPNVTGVLHMGHMLNNTIQDVLIRKKRMEGKNACWVPGTDHASIATEAKVVKLLAEQGIKKSDITREQFLEHAFEWKEKYGGIILKQLEKLGASCDWDRTRFTMEEDLSAAVIEVFVNLYNKGMIYRGIRMVNWDPVGKTALSDDEVIHREVQSKLYYVKYAVEGMENEFVTIATTRPETILGDSAICINPTDERFQHLKGKRVIVPMVNRSIPIIEDEYVDVEFGTGCLKVTPAHDVNDYELGMKHNLETIDVISEDGSMSESAQFFVGEDRFVVRKKIAKELDAMGQLVKEEDYTNKVGFSERTDAVIEPRISTQWFLKMQDLAKPALDAVMSDDIQLHPPKFKNTYRHWMENVHDWCISRQLWWGQQIPAYYLPDGKVVVAETAEEALVKAQEINPALTAADLTQDEDVLDTWFSSWLWPISVFDGFKNPENEDIKYYYPTNDLVTGPDILFFWVARMIMAGTEFKGEIPFKNVYLTGIVRDEKRRKMSKSLGNSPDPLDLIAQYGADGVRSGILFSASAGNDLLFDIKLVEQGRNFANKIWNAFRLVKGLEVSDEITADHSATINWFRGRMNQVLAEIEDHFEKFRIQDALMAAYKLVWSDFCSWYLELIKPTYGEPIDRATYNATIEIFEEVVKILHPFMPFLTEELWHQMADRKAEDALIIAQWPKGGAFDETMIAATQNAFDVISQIRNVRSSKGISPKETFNLSIKGAEADYKAFEGMIQKLANIEVIDYVAEAPANATSFRIKNDEFFIPMEGQIDVEAEKENITKELEYTKGFLNSVMKKLSNERFVNNAPEAVVASETKKKEDAEMKIKTLEEALKNLG